MHKCKTCQREFSQKSSLTRHQQNHAKLRGYICSDCQTTFYRHDLLVRHRQIHLSKDESSMDTPSKRRKRSRTACVYCQQSRVKCSGEKPCTRCLRLMLNCSFRESTGRVSTDNAIFGSSPSLEVASGAQNNVSDLSERIEASYGAAASQSVVAESTTLLEGAHIPLTPWTPRNLSWPWLHEDMFLHDGLNLDWFSLTEEAESREQVQPSNALLQASHSENVPELQGPECEPLEQSGKQSLPVTAQSTQHVSYSQTQHEFIDEIVQSAVLHTKTRPRQHLDPCTSVFTEFCKQSSPRAQALFGIDCVHLKNSLNSKSDCCFDLLVELYLKHFWPLWPLFPRYNWTLNKFRPLLYLTLASIGGMYGGHESSLLARRLHKTLRDAVAETIWDFDLAEQDALALGQTRVLVQAAALYFGQPKAFSYSQHIAGVLVAQLRRMGTCSRVVLNPTEVDTSNEQVWIGKWIHRECEKRLTFAVMRLQCYTSVLHSARPLLSAEEMDIELPCPQHLWYGEFNSPTAFASAIRQDLEGDKPPLLFSDLLRIAMDPEETLPRLKFLEQELLMNGLQEYVWLAANGSKTLSRLVPEPWRIEGSDSDDGLDRGRKITDPRANPGRQPPSYREHSIDAYIERHSRRLSSLRQRRHQVIGSLRRWQAVCFVKEVPSTISDRSSLLSCLLLYHLAFLQLRCPLETMHTLPYLPEERSPSQQGILADILKWSKSEDSVVALKHAIAIAGLIQSETRRPPTNRSQVNFLTLVGLYHGAAVVWTLAGTSIEPVAGESASTAGTPDIVGLEVDHGRLSICQANKVQLMEAFLKLYADISPAWAGKSSFSAAVIRMRGLDFPSGTEAEYCE